MPKFNIKNYQGKHAMHCKTEIEAETFCNYLHSIGRKWCDYDSYENTTEYNRHKSSTVYYFNKGEIGNVECAQAKGYTILEWSDFMKHTFKKSDLKTGDIILRRDDSVEIVNLELNTLIGQSGWDDIDDIREDLTCIIDSAYDIVAVRRPVEKCDCVFSAFKSEHGVLVYERPEVEEMTLAEVCKALGKEIKIVKE